MNINLLLLYDKLRQNRQAIAILVLIVGTAIVGEANPGISHTMVKATVLSSVNNPGRNQATDTIVFVELEDGGTTAAFLADAAIPPAQGKNVNLWRVRRLLFGEYFLIANSPSP